MRRVLILIVSLIATATAAVERLNYTTDRELIRKQVFIHQVMWKPEDLNCSFPDIVRRAENFTIKDLRSLPVDQNSAETLIDRWESNELVARNSSVTATNSHHLMEIQLVLDALLGVPEFDTFALISLFLKKQLNPILWYFETVIAVLHREDTKYVRLPNNYELTPFYYYNRDVVEQLRRIEASDDCTIKPSVIEGNYSKITSQPYGDDKENRLVYFTEDVGLNSYYFYHTLDLPFWFSSSDKCSSSKCRRGERYFFEYQQLLARYELERLSNDLGEVEDIEWDKRILTGYYPEMNDFNGRPLPIRPCNATIPSHKEVENLNTIESRLAEAADTETLKLVNDESKRANHTADENFDDFMNAVQGNRDSVNRNYYRSFDVLPKLTLSFSPKSSSYRNITVGALENLNTNLRDPAFYRVCKKVVDLGLRYKSHVRPYTEEELSFPGVAIDAVEVDRIVTYFDKFDAVVGHRRRCKDAASPIIVRQKRLNRKGFAVRVTITRNAARKAFVRLFMGPKYDVRGATLGIEDTRSKFDAVVGHQRRCEDAALPILVRQKRLNHENFTVRVTISSEVSRRAVVRLFIGPKYDVRGATLGIEDARSKFFQLDHFAVDLKKGRNSVVRDDADFAYQVPDSVNNDEFYKIIQNSSKGEAALPYYERPYGYPRRLMIPRGKADGLKLQLFVVVSPLDAEKIVRSDTRISGRKFSDGRAFGFPLDRPVKEAGLELSNMAFQDVTVYYNANPTA